MKKLRVLFLAHPELLPPDDLTTVSDSLRFEFKTEYDVITTLRASGHEVKPLGVQYELSPIRDEVENWKPDIVFNMLEEFHSNTLYAQNVASLLELLKVPYTGCNPRGQMLARGKDLSKKLLKYHRIPTPAFAVFPVGRKVKRPRGLPFPLIVKSLSEDASLGISQASVVEDDEALEKRCIFIHEKIGTAAIAEQYIEGREIYVGVLGNERRYVLPIWELEFSKLAASSLPIATAMVKHNPDYQEKRGVLQGRAKDLPPSLETRIRKMVLRICETLELDGYARIDFRLAPDGTAYFIEANPNPDIASSQEFAQAALFDGVSYGDLLDRILDLGIRRAGLNGEG
jgi:D-alanine-D-alanine ligase